MSSFAVNTSTSATSRTDRTTEIVNARTKPACSFFELIRLAAVALSMCAAGPAFSQVDVLTHHNDRSRTGANLSESQLNTATVNRASFGKLFEYSVDGPIFGQPLVVTNLAIPGKGARNVVFVATMNNSVYAYDADDPTVDAGQPIWRVNFNNAAAGITPVPSGDVSNNRNYKGPFGIMGTPVIDRDREVIYLVARTKENNQYFYRLHALDIVTGAEKSGSPVVIDATLVNSAGTTLSLNPRRQAQRPALALANGLVYIGWASTEDIDPYQGWLVAYNADTLAREAIFNTVPTGTRGAIWMSGHAPGIDANGNLYIGIGNGTFAAYTVYPLDGSPFSASSGDFNGDGYPDIAVGVYAANDGTAGGAIAAMKGAGVNPSTKPTTGQDAELAGIQRIVAGQQYMTVYKAIKTEARDAAQLAVDALNGKTSSSLVNRQVNNGQKDVPSVILTPVAVTQSNIDSTVVKDGFWTVKQICTSAYASACAKIGLTGGSS